MKKLPLLILLNILVPVLYGQNYCQPSFESGKVLTTNLKIRFLYFNEDGEPNSFSHVNHYKGVNGYIDYSKNLALQGFLVPGEEYPVKIGIEQFEPVLGKKIAAFYDWDGDGTFEDSDVNFIKFPSNNSSGTGTIRVPASVSSSNVRVRFILKPDVELLNEDAPCENGELGDARDYNFRIKGSTSMTYINTSIIKNTAPIYPHSYQDEMLIGFNIQTAGGAENLKLVSAEFEGANGVNHYNDISTIRLIYTGPDPKPYSTDEHINATQTNSSGLIRTTNLNLDYLLPGDNWFWLMVRPAENTQAQQLEINLKELKILSNGVEQVYGGFTNPNGARVFSNINYCVDPNIFDPEEKFRSYDGYIDTLSFAGLEFSQHDYNYNFLSKSFNSFITSIDPVHLCFGDEQELTIKARETSKTIGAYTLQYFAYFDWNQDGDFEESDEAYYLGAVDLGVENTVKNLVSTITPPASAKPGHSVFRLVSRCGTHTSTYTCQLGCGEIQEFGYYLHSPGNLGADKEFSTLGSDLKLGVKNLTGSPLNLEASYNSFDWNTVGVAPQNDSILVQAIDSTIFYRLSQNNANCPNGVSYSPMVNIPFAGIKNKDNEAISCIDDSTLIIANYEYPIKEFSTLETGVLYNESGFEFPAMLNLAVNDISEEFISITSLDSVCFTMSSRDDVVRAEVFLIPPGGGDKTQLRIGQRLSFRRDSVTGIYEKTARFCFVNNGKPLKNDDFNYGDIYSFDQDLDRLSQYHPNGNWALMAQYSTNSGRDEVVFSDFKMSFGINSQFGWSPGNTLSDSTSTATYAKPVSSTTYTSSITNRHGNFTDETTVFVPNSEEFEVNIEDHSLSNCEGSALDYKAEFSHDIFANNIQWLVNNIAVAGATQETFSSSQLKNQDKLTVKSTLETACGDFIPEDSKTLSLKPVLNPSLTLAGQDQFPSCEQRMLAFAVDTSNFGAGASINWKINNTTIQSGGSNFNSNSLADGDIILVEVNSSYPCASTPRLSESIEAEIISKKTPSVLISTATPEFCEGETAQFAISDLKDEGSNPVFQWKKNGANIPNETSNILTINTLESGDEVSVLMQSNASCITDQEVESNVESVDVYELPNADFSFERMDGKYNFTPTVLTLDNYSWDFGDGNSSTSTTPTHEYANTGKYLVCLTGTNNLGCVNNSCKEIDFTTGIFENKARDVYISAYPNPTNGSVKLVHNKFTNLDNINVISSDGRVVNAPSNLLGNVLQFDFTELDAGTYLVAVETEDSTIRAVIIKQ